MNISLIENCYFKRRMNELGLGPAEAAVACGASVASIDKWCRASAGLVNTKTGIMYNLPNGDNQRRVEMGLEVDNIKLLFPHHYPEYAK